MLHVFLVLMSFAPTAHAVPALLGQPMACPHAAAGAGQCGMRGKAMPQPLDGTDELWADLEDADMTIDELDSEDQRSRTTLFEYQPRLSIHLCFGGPQSALAHRPHSLSVFAECQHCLILRI